MTTDRLSYAELGSSCPLGPNGRPVASAKNVQQIARLELEQLHARTVSERIAGAVTTAAGTATFALAHLIWFAGWIVINAGWVSRWVRPFDPFPFNLLTMIVSLEAIFLSIWILISQKQMTRRADRRAHLDLQVNLLAEQESTATLRILRQVAAHLGVNLADSADASLADETDLEHLASAMDAVLPEVPGAGSSPPTQPPAPVRT